LAVKYGEKDREVHIANWKDRLRIPWLEVGVDIAALLGLGKVVEPRASLDMSARSDVIEAYNLGTDLIESKALGVFEASGKGGGFCPILDPVSYFLDSAFRWWCRRGI